MKFNFNGPVLITVILKVLLFRQMYEVEYFYRRAPRGNLREPQRSFSVSYVVLFKWDNTEPVVHCHRMVQGRSSGGNSQF